MIKNGKRLENMSDSERRTWRTYYQSASPFRLFLRNKLISGYRLRKEFRAALLTSKKNIDAQSRSNREELLRSAALNEKQSSGKSK